MSKVQNSKARCKKCGKFVGELPCHTNLCIDCYFNPKTTINIVRKWIERHPEYSTKEADGQ